MSKLRDLIHEVHRRSLWQVLGIYVVGGWLILQFVDTLAGALNLPDWASPLALFLLIIGLPVVLATAFVQEGIGSHEPDSSDVETTAGGTPVPGTGPSASGGGKLLTWRNAVLGGMAAFALWGIGAAGWMVFFGVRGEASDSDAAISMSETRIAVLPFSIQGGEEYAYLHEGLVDLLSTKLDGAGELRTVDPQAILSAIDVSVNESIDPEKALGVARRFGAGRYLTGTVVEAGGRISVRASLYDANGDAEVTAEAVAETEADVFAVVDHLARELLAGRVADEGSARITQLAALTTDSLKALKAFLEGTALFRSGALEGAVAAFERAVAIDTTFALAYYRLSIAHEWWGGGDLAQSMENAERAVQFADRLSERDRRLFEALQTWRRGDGLAAAELYQEILLSYPDEVEAWSQLGEVLFHYGPTNGRSVREARTPFERALELDPEQITAMIHLIRLDALDRDTASVRLRVERILELSPDHDFAVEARADLAFAVRDSGAIQQLLRETDTPNMYYLPEEASVFAHNPDAGLAVAATLADPQQPWSLRRFGLITRAEMYLSRGQWRAGLAELGKLDAIAEADSLGSAIIGLQMATSAIERSDDEIREFRDRVSRQRERLSAAEAPDEVLGLAYVLGLLSIRLGDEPSALRAADALEDLGLPEGMAATFGSAPADLGLSLRARAAFARGDRQAALDFIGEQKRHVQYDLSRAFALFSRAYDRYMVGAILKERGDYEDALRWYESIEGHSTGDLPFVAPSHLRRAEIYEELGDTTRAAFHYAEFVNLWTDADPEYQPMVEAARQRLSTLLPDSG